MEKIQCWKHGCSAQEKKPGRKQKNWDLACTHWDLRRILIENEATKNGDVVWGNGTTWKHVAVFRIRDWAVPVIFQRWPSNNKKHIWCETRGTRVLIHSQVGSLAIGIFQTLQESESGWLKVRDVFFPGQWFQTWWLFSISKDGTMIPIDFYSFWLFWPNQKVAKEKTDVCNAYPSELLLSGVFFLFKYGI